MLSADTTSLNVFISTVSPALSQYKKRKIRSELVLYSYMSLMPKTAKGLQKNTRLLKLSVCSSYTSFREKNVNKGRVG